MVILIIVIKRSCSGGFNWQTCQRNYSDALCWPKCQWNCTDGFSWGTCQRCSNGFSDRLNPMVYKDILCHAMNYKTKKINWAFSTTLNFRQIFLLLSHPINFLLKIIQIFFPMWKWFTFYLIISLGEWERNTRSKQTHGRLRFLTIYIHFCIMCMLTFM